LRMLEQFGFDLYSPELMHSGPKYQLSVLGGIEEFREHLGGVLAVTLLRNIGEGFEVHEMDISRVVESIRELQTRRAARRLNQLIAAV